MHSLLQVVELPRILAQYHVRDFDRAGACDLAIMHHLGEGQAESLPASRSGISSENG
jgi:hypothetical protein